VEDEIRHLFMENNYRLLEGPLIPRSAIRFCHSVIVDNAGYPIAGGFSDEFVNARKIAVSELIERNTFKQLANSDTDLQKSWGIDIHPTACGFAGGFDLLQTRRRSLSEAVERWVMSLWIDDHFQIEEVPAEEVFGTLDEASNYIVRQFDEVRFFIKSVDVEFDGSTVPILVAQTMGFKGNGVFPGSSAQSTGGNYWQHALIESYRHLIGARNNPDRGNMFPQNKVRFFAHNADIALKQIHAAYKTDWPEPKVILTNVKSLFDGKFFVARTIVDGWRNWSEGPIERFLY